MGRRPGESLGSASGREQVVHEGNLAHALSLFSGDAPAAIEGDHDVGSMVLHQLCLRGALRCGGRLFLWLAGIPLSRVRVFLLNRIAPRRCSLDPGALHVRF